MALRTIQAQIISKFIYLAQCSPRNPNCLTDISNCVFKWASQTRDAYWKALNPFCPHIFLISVEGRALCQAHVWLPIPHVRLSRSPVDPSPKYDLKAFTSPQHSCCHPRQATWLLGWINFRASSTTCTLFSTQEPMGSFKHLNQVMLLPCFLLAIIKPRSLPVALHLFGSLAISPVVFFLFIIQAHWKFQRIVRLVLASVLFLFLLPRNFLPLSLPGRVWILIKQSVRVAAKF